MLLISSARQRAAEGGLSVLGEELLGGGSFGGRQRALQGESVGLRDRVGFVETGGESLGHVEGEAIIEQDEGLQRRGGVGPTSALQEVVFLILSGLHYFSAVFLHYILHRF